MDRTDLEVLAQNLRRLLLAIETGEMSATAATRHRLEGALAALEAVLGDPSTLLERLGLESK
jgi:hypothetical protein